MKSIFGLIKEIWIWNCHMVKTKYKWMLIFFILWVYRVSCMPADGGGIAKGIQIATTFGL